MKERVLTGFEIGYYAGLFDGEGHIAIGKKAKYFQPQIEVTMVNKEIPQRFRDTFGGCILTRKRNHKNKNWRDATMWCLTGFEHIVNFLTIIRPYLIEKKEQAEIMIKFCNSREKKIGTRKGYDKAELSMIEDLKAARRVS